MNTRNHLLLDEYLAGKLEKGEKKKFLDRLESDEDLQRLVEAERIIKQSVISDKQELEQIDHSGTYAFLMAGLAASAVVAATSTTAVAASKSISTIATAKSIGATVVNIPGKIGVWSLASSLIASAVIGVASYKLSTPEPEHIVKKITQKITTPKDAISDPVQENEPIRKRKRDLRYEDFFHDIYGNVIEPKPEPLIEESPNQ